MDAGKAPSVVTRTGLDGPEIISLLGQETSLQIRPERLWGQPSLILNSYGGIATGARCCPPICIQRRVSE